MADDKIDEMRRITIEWLKQFDYEGFIRLLAGTLEVLESLAANTKDPEASQRMLSYKGQLEGALAQARENSDEKMMQHFEAITGHINPIEEPERPSEGLQHMLDQVKPLLARAKEIEVKEEPDIKKIEKIETDVIESLKQGKGKGKRFYKYVDNINRMMKVIKQRDDRERKKLESLLSSTGTGSLSELKENLDSAKQRFDEADKRLSGFITDTGFIKPGDESPSKSREKQGGVKKAKNERASLESKYKGIMESYDSAMALAKTILKLRAARLDRILRRVDWMAGLFEKNRDSIVNLGKEMQIIKSYKSQLSEPLHKISIVIAELQQHPRFTQALNDAWNDFKNYDELKEENVGSLQEAVDYLTNFMQKISSTLQRWEDSKELLLNDQARLARIIEGLNAKLADAISRAKDMLDGKEPVDIEDLPLAGSDDPIMKNFNQAVFNMRNHVPQLSSALKKFIVQTNVLRRLVFLIGDAVRLAEEGPSGEKAGVETPIPEKKQEGSKVQPSAKTETVTSETKKSSETGTGGTPLTKEDKKKLNKMARGLITDFKDLFKNLPRSERTKESKSRLMDKQLQHEIAKLNIPKDQADYVSKRVKKRFV